MKQGVSSENGRIYRHGSAGTSEEEAIRQFEAQVRRIEDAS
ncbi:hypothetical protein [Desulfosporosinus sp. Sb-LF]|nr:hypothetical protein [Desulfosporosinus sp. Sb-LF]